MISRKFQNNINKSIISIPDTSRSVIIASTGENSHSNSIFPKTNARGIVLIIK